MKQIAMWGAWVCLAAVTPARSATRPPDVPAGHWAASAVQELVDSSVLSLPDGKRFLGEARITRAQTVIALSRLARSLETGAWKRHTPRPLDRTAAKAFQSGSWQQKPVSRYAAAVALARFGDYFANGVRNAPQAARNTGKSVLLTSVTMPAGQKGPAAEALAYLTKNRMLRAGSSLLKPDSQPVRAAELSRALADMAIGLNDRVTDLGLDANGETPDRTFHKKPPKAGTAPGLSRSGKL